MSVRNAWTFLPGPLTLCVVVLLVCCYLAPFADLDFTWQIRTGAQIVQTGQLRTVDEFSYTIHGQPVHDFEWLFEVLLYWTWTALGVGGLKLLKVVLVAAPLWLLARHLGRQQVPPPAVALALFAAVLILLPAWNLRAFYCTTLGLLLVATWLHDHGTGRRPLDWRLPVVMLLWANLHPGVIAGQGLLFGAIAWEWLNRWLRLNRPLDQAALRRLVLIGGLGLLATLVSPDPLDRLLYPFRPELRHPIHHTFVEMQPMASFMLAAPVVVLGTYLIAALVAVSVIARFREYRLWEIALLVTLGLLANVAVRGLQDWLLLLLALGVPHVAALLLLRPQRSSLSPKRERGPALACASGSVSVVPAGVISGKRLVDLDPSWFRVQPAWVAAAFATLFVITLVRPVSTELPMAANCPCPTGAVAFMQEKNLHGKFFAPPNYGSYLGWALGPRAQVYVDTRGFFFPPLLLEDSHELPQLGPGWQERLDRILDDYATDYFLLETTGPRGELWYHLHAKNIQPLYVDEHSVLLSAAQVRHALLPRTAGAAP